MEFAEITLLVMVVAWLFPMGVLVSFLMWRYSASDLDAWVQSSESHSRKEEVREARQQASFAYDLNNIDLSRVRRSMLKPKVSAQRYAAAVE